jgi:hypothetical protein
MSIDSEETAANFESILSGKLPGAELVIGLVGAVGAELIRVVEVVGICLEKYGYSTKFIRVSGLIKQIVEIPLRRKVKHTGKILPWDPQGGTIRTLVLAWHYLQRDEFAVNILKPHLRGENDGHRGDDACQAGPTEPGAVDCGDAAGDCKC